VIPIAFSDDLTGQASVIDGYPLALRRFLISGQHRSPVCVPKTPSELMTRWNRLSWREIGLICFFLAVLASSFKSKLRPGAENAVPRHQLLVLIRKLLVASGSRTMIAGS
jgi:hypothetical protein